MAMNIKDVETERLAAEVAELTGLRGGLPDRRAHARRDHLGPGAQGGGTGEGVAGRLLQTDLELVKLEL
ncbi:hypothetical protein [Amycolatopsis solani]|uniref:hypothetical protein n=1 Tax=Amycolatopsis solani TaxID=3028615 RepID=UPI0025AF0299|nr:hypothetical protein [Amycolatopsis sp. MEP2-6]